MPGPPWPELEEGADARTTSANCVRVVWVRECVKSISDGTNIPPLDGTNFIAEGMAAEASSGKGADADDGRGTTSERSDDDVA